MHVGIPHTIPILPWALKDGISNDIGVQQDALAHSYVIELSGQIKEGQDTAVKCCSTLKGPFPNLSSVRTDINSPPYGVER